MLINAYKRLVNVYGYGEYTFTATNKNGKYKQGKRKTGEGKNVQNETRKRHRVIVRELEEDKGESDKQREGKKRTVFS